MPEKSPQSNRSNKENDNTFGSPKKDLNEHNEIPQNFVEDVKTQLAKEK
jgi:hypothetical protein